MRNDIANKYASVLNRRRKMNEEDKKFGRRNFFKKLSKYFIGFGTFTIASILGLKRNGDLRYGKMKNLELGLSEAHGMCSASMDCAGGGGQCSASMDCAGS